MTWPLTLPKKWPQQFRNYFWRSFDCRLPRVAAWLRNRVRGGMVFKHPGLTRSVPSTGTARLSYVYLPTYIHCEFLGPTYSRIFWNKTLNFNICRNEEQLTDQQNIQRYNIFFVRFFLGKKMSKSLDMYMDYWRGLYPTPKYLRGSDPRDLSCGGAPGLLPTAGGCMILHERKDII